MGDLNLVGDKNADIICMDTIPGMVDSGGIRRDIENLIIS